MKVSYSLAATALITASATAFAPSIPTLLPTSSSISSSSSSSSISMAGFGDSGGGMSKKKKGKNSKPNKSPILKPKAQWDRYGSLKKSTGIRAAARVANDGQDSGEWYEVGRVKSEGDEFTEIAVALQRGIIAEHAKRLYPLQFLPKDKVDWAYTTTATPEQEDWIQIDKSTSRDVPAGVEKQIGFEGKPDTATGFYCNYKGGRLVDKYDEGKSLAKE